MVVPQSAVTAWWQCGNPDNFHDMGSFDLDTEKCTVCGMDVEEYWSGYEAEIGGIQRQLTGAYRIGRTSSRSRPPAAVYVEEGENNSSPKRPERAYIQLGMGE